MRSIPISENDGVLFNSPFHPGVDVLYRTHLKEIRRMVKSQGEGFWIQFITSFRAFATNNGGVAILSTQTAEEAFIEMLEMLTSSDNLTKFCTLAESLRAMNYAILRRDYFVIMDPILRAVFTNYKKPLETLKLYVRFFTSFIVLFQRWQDAPRAKRRVPSTRWVPPAVWGRPGIEYAPRTFEGYLKAQWGRGLYKLLRVDKSNIAWLYVEQARSSIFKKKSSANPLKKEFSNSKNVKPLAKDTAFGQAPKRTSNNKEVPKENGPDSNLGAKIKNQRNTESPQQDPTSQIDRSPYTTTTNNNNNNSSSKHRQPQCSKKANVHINEVNSSVSIGVASRNPNKVPEENDSPACNKMDNMPASFVDHIHIIEDRGKLSEVKESINREEETAGNTASCINNNSVVDEKNKVCGGKGSSSLNNDTSETNEDANNDSHSPKILIYNNKNINGSNISKCRKDDVTKTGIHNDKNDNYDQEDHCVKNDHDCKTKPEGMCLNPSSSSTSVLGKSQCVNGIGENKISPGLISNFSSKKITLEKTENEKPLGVTKGSDLNSTVKDIFEEKINLKINETSSKMNAVSQTNALKDKGNNIIMSTDVYSECNERSLSELITACSGKVNVATQTDEFTKVNAASQTNELPKISVASQTGKSTLEDEPVECLNSKEITNAPSSIVNDNKNLAKRLEENPTASSVNGYTKDMVNISESKPISTGHSSLVNDGKSPSRGVETLNSDAVTCVNTCAKESNIKTPGGKQIGTRSKNLSSGIKKCDDVPEDHPTATTTKNVASSTNKQGSTVHSDPVINNKKHANQKGETCIKSNAARQSNISASRDLVDSNIGQNNFNEQATFNSKNSMKDTILEKKDSKLPPTNISTTTESKTDTIRVNVKNQKLHQSVKHKSNSSKEDCPPKENTNDTASKPKHSLKTDPFSSTWKEQKKNTVPLKDRTEKDDGVFHGRASRTSGTSFGRPLRPPRPVIRTRLLLLKCDNCNILEAAPNTYKKCGRCLSQHVKGPKIYCSKHCQFVDWKTQHKAEHKLNKAEYRRYSA